MATAFQSVNANLPARSYQMEVSTPTTPRAPRMTPPPSQSLPAAEESAPSTPTRHSFGGVNGQRPLPSPRFESSMSSSTPQAKGQPHPDTLIRGSSHRSVRSVDSQDIDMDDSDEGEEGSDGESVDGESGRPSKKKKGQRFFCTEFPPCNLSFTRSEHLARHIR